MCCVYSLRNKIKIMYVISFLIIYFTAVLIFKETGLIIANIISIFFSVSIVLPLFTDDHKDDWYYFSTTLPIRHTDIVLSRYTVMGVVLATISLFNLIVDSIFLLFYNQYSILVYLSVIGLSIAISVIYTSLLIPAGYLAGINGSSIVFLILIVIFMLVQNLLKTSMINEIFKLSNYILFFCLFLVCLLFLLIWIYLSFRITKKMVNQCPNTD